MNMNLKGWDAQGETMARVNTARMETVETLILIPGVFALLLTAGYHIVSLFVQLTAHEYSAVVWHSHF